MNSDPFVGVDLAQGKRQWLAQQVETCPHADLALAQHGAGLEGRAWPTWPGQPPMETR